MIWSVLTDLACSLVIWPVLFQGLGLDRPVAYDPVACSCSPCTCKDRCTCEKCKCSPCPGMTTAWTGEDGLERVGVDFSGPCAMPCAHTMAAPCACPPCAACPTYPTAVPGSPLQAYEVFVRLIGEGIGDREKGYTFPPLTLMANSDGLLALNLPDGHGSTTCRMMHLHLGQADGDSVKMHLSLASAHPSARTADQFEGEKKIHLDTVTGLVLTGKKAEPCCAEVMVHPASRGSLLPPVPIYEPAPHPHCAPPTAHWAPIPMPPPMPYAPIPGMPPPAADPMICWPVPPAAPRPAEPVAMPMPMPLPPGPPIALVGMAPPLPPPLPRRIDGPRAYPIHASSHLRVVHEMGKSRVQMKAKDGTCSTSVRMKVQTGPAGSLQFAAGKKHVHVCGKMWKAQADRVEVFDDGRIVLCGHVKVVSDKVGVCASIKAEHVCLRVKHGKVEKISGDVFSQH
jgi:hypothetical protein